MSDTPRTVTRARHEPRPPDEPDVLGEWNPLHHLRLSLVRTGDREAVLRRHRVGPGQAPDALATVTWDAEADAAFMWDEHHRTTRPPWVLGAERWFRRIIADLEGQGA